MSVVASWSVVEGKSVFGGEEANIHVFGAFLGRRDCFLWFVFSCFIFRPKKKKERHSQGAKMCVSGDIRKPQSLQFIPIL